MNTWINLIHIRDVLAEWASEDEQRRLWLSTGANGADVSSFDEAREWLFTTTGIGDELDKGRVVFDEKIDAMLIQLDRLIGEIDPYRAPGEIIEDGRMPQVRSLAEQILDTLPDVST